LPLIATPDAYPPEGQRTTSLPRDAPFQSDMPSAQDRIARTLDLLTQGVSPFVERELQAIYRDNWQDAARSSFREDRGVAINKGEQIRWDTHSLLTVMWDQWNSVFRTKLGHAERSLVSELREYRNRWAHQQQFSFEDTYRILDSVERLLAAVSAPEADLVRQERRTLMQEEVAYLFYQLEPYGWLVSVLIVVLFMLLTYKRLQPQPLSLGPHECPRCHRIIYSSLCPYCQSGKAERFADV